MCAGSLATCWLRISTVSCTSRTATTRNITSRKLFPDSPGPSQLPARLAPGDAYRDGPGLRVTSHGPDGFRGRALNRVRRGQRPNASASVTTGPAEESPRFPQTSPRRPRFLRGAAITSESDLQAVLGTRSNPQWTRTQSRAYLTNVSYLMYSTSAPDHHAVRVRSRPGGVWPEHETSLYRPAGQGIRNSLRNRQCSGPCPGARPNIIRHWRLSSTGPGNVATSNSPLLRCFAALEGEIGQRSQRRAVNRLG